MSNREIDNEYDFARWLGHAKPGEMITYHTGLLMRDRQATHTGKDRVKTQIDEYAKAVLSAADMGMLTLVQRRLDEHNCEYLAVKR